MADLASASAALNRIHNVLSIQPDRGKGLCVISVLRDTPEVRAAIEKVMTRHRLPYRIRLVERSPEYIAAVERIAWGGQARQDGKSTPLNKLAAHTHRPRRGGTP